MGTRLLPACRKLVMGLLLSRSAGGQRQCGSVVTLASITWATACMRAATRVGSPPASCSPGGALCWRAFRV